MTVEIIGIETLIRRMEALKQTGKVSVMRSAIRGGLNQIGKWGKGQRGRIDAIAQAGGRWAVRKDMAQMRVTHLADDFGTQHAMATVGNLGHMIRV